MKSLTTFFIALVLANFIQSGLNSKTGNNSGETYNIDGRPLVGAVAYGKASAGGYVIKDDSRYIKPEMVSQIPNTHAPAARGPVEVVDEIPSATNYYDGGAKLNKIVINCHIYANPTDCVHQSRCGWCGATNGCIAGTNMGPLESCNRSSYIFAASFPNLGAQPRITHNNVGGISLTVLSK